MSITSTRLPMAARRRSKRGADTLLFETLNCETGKIHNRAHAIADEVGKVVQNVKAPFGPDPFEVPRPRSAFPVAICIQSNASLRRAPRTDMGRIDSHASGDLPPCGCWVHDCTLGAASSGQFGHRRGMASAIVESFQYSHPFQNQNLDFCRRDRSSSRVVLRGFLYPRDMFGKRRIPAAGFQGYRTCRSAEDDFRR